MQKGVFGVLLLIEDTLHVMKHTKTVDYLLNEAQTQ